MSPFQCYHRLIHHADKNEQQFEGVLLKCPTNLDIHKFQDSTQVLPILGVLEGVYSLKLVSFEKQQQQQQLMYKLPILVPIFLWAR